MVKLNDIFNTWLEDGGIFNNLQSLNVPWKSKNISLELGMVYHGTFSGDKNISPLISKMFVDGELTPTGKSRLANILFAIYGEKWDSLWQTMYYEYNPIENYSMTEIMSNDEKVIAYGKQHTRQDNLVHAKTGNETDNPNVTETRTDNLHKHISQDTTTTPNITETTTPNLTNNTQNNVSGFNSSDAVNTDGQTVTATGNSTLVRTGEEEVNDDVTEDNTGTQQNTRTGTEQRVYNTQDSDTGTVTDLDDGEDIETRNYELTRNGNIGVTTTQQMIEQERNIKMWDYFYRVVYPDIDRILTIQIY